MSHIRLKAESVWTVNQLQQLRHVLPAVHPAPANLSFGGQLFSIAVGNVAGLPKSLREQFCIFVRILRPLFRRSSGVNPDHSVTPNAKLSQFAADTAGTFHLVEKAVSLLFAANR